MNQSERIQLFADGTLAVRAQFFEDKLSMTRLGALLLCSSGRQSLENLVDCKQQLIAEKPDSLTAAALPFLVPALAVAAEPDRTLRCWLKAALLLKQTYSAVAYTLPAAALLVRFLPDETDMPAIIKKSKQTYDELSFHHPILTGYEDVGALLLLALQGRQDDADRILECGRLLKPLRCSANLKQTLACILALYSEPEQAVSSFFTLKAALKENKLRPGGLALIGLTALAGSEAPCELLSSEIVRLKRKLWAKPGFGLFSTTTRECLYLACMLTALGQAAEPLVFCTALLGAVNANLPDTPEPLLSIDLPN